LSNNVFQLINFVQIVYFLAIGVAMLALIYLRHLMPDANRPIKVRDVRGKK
jgi:solute carrier family 7 L-type amino acid transporter-like protein